MFKLLFIFLINSILCTFYILQWPVMKFVYFLIDGGYTAFGLWGYAPGSSCSASCGPNGVQLQVQSRTCTNPAPLNGGALCVGVAEQFRNVSCQVQPPSCRGKIVFKIIGNSGGDFKRTNFHGRNISRMSSSAKFFNIADINFRHR